MAHRHLGLGFLLFFTSFYVCSSTRDIVHSRGRVLELGSRLNSLEKEVGSRNAQYLLKLEESNQIEKQIAEAESINESIAKKYHAEEKKYNSILRSFALSAVEDEALPKKQYKELIQKKKQNVLEALSQLNQVQELLKLERKKLDQLREESQQMAKTLIDLEQNKKNLTAEYLTHIEKKDLAESKIQTQKLSTKLSALKKISVDQISAQRIFGAPLSSFMSLTPTEKGVTFQFEESQPIKAALGGRVLYYGDLSSYGKVLMLDHGDNLRSVMLGYIDSNLKKDDRVNKGEVLGFIRAEKSPSSLYFEVRKGNAVQKTIYWLDEASLSKI